MNMFSASRLLLAAVASLLAVSAIAQSAYPSRPIKMIVPLAPGSAVDNVARILTQKMGQNIGRPVLVENIPGSSGVIGAEKLAKSSPDGYTLGGFNDSILTIVPHIYPRLGWNALADFDPVSLAATLELGLVVKSDSAIKSVAELIGAAKAMPGRMNFSSGGSGSPQHIAMSLFASQAGFNMTHVPYKGATPAAVAVAAGEVDVSFQGLATVTSLLQGGKLRLLAVSSSNRSSQYPNIPTIDESGLRNFSFSSWFAVVVPAGTPKAVVERLNAEVRAALADPDTKAKIVAQGVVPRGTSVQELALVTKEQFEAYRNVIRERGIRAE